MAFQLSMVTAFRLASAWWLAALSAAALPAVLAARARRRGRHIRPAAVALQTLAIIAAALALARPCVPLGGKAALPQLILRDVSASTRVQCEAGLALPTLPKTLPRETVDFAADISASRRDETLVASPLRLAEARARNGQIAGVVIVTDGRFLDFGGDWSAAAAALGRTGAPVLIVPLVSPPVDVRIADFRARRDAAGNCLLRVTVVANAPARRRLRVWRRDGPGTPILDRTLNLLRDDSATIRLTDAAPADAAIVYRAELDAGDAFAENDSASAAVLPVRRRVAVVAGPRGYRADRLSDALGLAITRISPDSAPRDAGGWMDYAAVVLVDSAGTLLDSRRRAALAEFVRGGGGLVLLGAGPHASPRDRQDDLTRVAALVANPDERNPLKVVVVLDESGSMGQRGSDGVAASAGQVKFDIAREAVLSLKRHLTGGDSLSVITFSDRPNRLYDGGARPEDFAVLREALGRVLPSGPTKVIPALRLATTRPPPTGREGLVLLVSDLLTESYTGADVEELRQRFVENRWSLAIVATMTAGAASPAQRPMLEALGERLDAPLVRRDRLAGLSKVFGRFLRRARGEPIRRGSFRPTGQKALFGLEDAVLPKVDAYILSAPRGGAEVLASIGADPLLARRQVGLGRSVSLAAPLGEKNNAALRNWARFDALVAAAARWALRTGDDPRFAAEFRRRAGKMLVRLDARDAAGPMNLLKLTGRAQPLAGFAAEPVEAALRQVAPGQYEADIPIGKCPVSLAVTWENRVVWRGTLGASAGREFEAIGADFENLRRLAALTGGRIVSRRELTTLAGNLDADRYTDLWPFLLAVAAALMLVEWAATRIRIRNG